MDKKESKGPNRWAWMPAAMPGVTCLVREKRALHGDAHVNECWRRGVVLGEPGWFFAREGTLAIGTPDPDRRAQWLASLDLSPTQVLLDMREPGAVDGAH